MELEAAIKTRHSIRRYSRKNVKWKHLVAVFDAARFAPSAGNISSLKLVLVTKKEKIKKIAEAAQQDFISAASALIVVCSDVKLTMMAYGKRGYTYSRQQAGAAIQNMLLKITELGLASCWIGAFDDLTVRNILAVPDSIDIEAILPVAHKSVIRETKRRPIDLRNILFFDKYGNRKR